MTDVWLIFLAIFYWSFWEQYEIMWYTYAIYNPQAASLWDHRYTRNSIRRIYLYCFRIYKSMNVRPYTYGYIIYVITFMLYMMTPWHEHVTHITDPLFVWGIHRSMLNKQSSCRWFEKSWRPCDVTRINMFCVLLRYPIAVHWSHIASV